MIIIKRYILVHEHLSICLENEKVYKYNFNNTQLVIDKLNLAQQKGLVDIVDLTNSTMGCSWKTLKTIQDGTDLNIHYCVGMYKDPYLPNLKNKSIDDILERISQEMDECNEQLGYLPIVCGEIGTSLNHFTNNEKKVFEACTILSKKYKLPIVTHTTLSTCASEQINFLVSNDISPNKILISHMDLSNDSNYLINILNKGVYIGFDTFGKERYKTDLERIEMLKNLLFKGYEDQICLSTDITETEELERMGYTYIIDSVVPKLEEAGLTNIQIDKLIYKNSYSFLYDQR